MSNERIKEIAGDLAGWLLFASVLAALSSGFFRSPPLVGGSLQWAAALLLWRRVPSRVLRQSLILAAAGALALLVAGAEGDAWLSALSKNQVMIAMLAAVGFLRLAAPSPGVSRPRRDGRGVWQTLFGVHWFGSMTNVSAIVLFGDQMANGALRSLSPIQALSLARGFALAIFWSPFFVAMGVALTLVPGAHLNTLVLWGLPLSQLMLAVTAWVMTRSASSLREGFAGYPFTPATLAGPVFLAGSVFTAHTLAPVAPVVTLVTLAAPLYGLLARQPRHLLPRLAAHVRQDLSRMGPELVLFLAAGLFGAGCSALIGKGMIPLPPAAPEVTAVVLGLAFIILLASTGVHPVAGVTAVAAMLTPLGIRPDLLALSLLMGWGLGILISPISGIHLLLAGRYNFPIRRVWRWNALPVAGGYLACCGWLVLFARFA